MSLVILIPVAALTSLTTLLLIITTNPHQPSDQNDLVRTALSVAAGTGGVVALVLAGRRQWHAEQAQRITEKAQQVTEHDAIQRRITDLYTKAADQLGSDKAPVRLAGLYALERLAQDNSGQRQTIVNVICAYLRMPYAPPTGKPPPNDTPDTDRSRHVQHMEEYQVRLTAQNILASHLHPGADPNYPLDTFWPDMIFDLTGATLADFKLIDCHLRKASFDEAFFSGESSFKGTRFNGAASFDYARFDGPAFFDRVQFIGNVSFRDAQFSSIAWFAQAHFRGDAWFGRTHFASEAWFPDTIFERDTAFYKTEFTDAFFRGAQFLLNPIFGDAQFAAGINFTDINFADGTDFTRGIFGEDWCWVRLDVPQDVVRRRAWPSGWTLTSTTERPDKQDHGQWGKVMRVPSNT